MPKNAQTTAQFSHASTVMLKILQARLQQYVNRELPDVHAGFRKGRGTRDQIANIHWITQESSTPQFKSINPLALDLLYGPTPTSLLLEKTIALTICTFVGKVMSLLFSKLSRFVIAFLPRSKHLLILWLQSLSAVILEPRKIKSAYRL